MFVWAVLLLVVGVVAVGAAALIANRAPLTGAPGVGARLALYLGSNVAVVEPDSPYPELRSPRYAATPREVTIAAAEVARQLGFEQVEVDAEAHSVTAVAVTPLLRFSDDIELRASRLDGGSVLTGRSASRLGRGDLGANQNHLRRLLEALATRLAPMPADG